MDALHAGAACRYKEARPFAAQSIKEWVRSVQALTGPPRGYCAIACLCGGHCTHCVAGVFLVFILCVFIFVVVVVVVVVVVAAERCLFVCFSVFVALLRSS